MKERFQQFEGLVDNCEFGTGEKPVNCEDLQGFWDMIYFQVLLSLLHYILASWIKTGHAWYGHYSFKILWCFWQWRYAHCTIAKISNELRHYEVICCFSLKLKKTGQILLDIMSLTFSCIQEEPVWLAKNVILWKTLVQFLWWVLFSSLWYLWCFADEHKLQRFVCSVKLRVHCCF